MEARKKGNGGVFVVLGIGLIIISLFAFFWGMNYTNNFQNMASAGLSSLMGRTDSTFSMARMATNFSPFTFLAGLILAIVGFIKR